jgi:microcystin-dependent protein
MTSILRISSANTARTKPTTGDIKMSFVNDDHLGWLLCNGRELDKVCYKILFDVIGYEFGHGSGTSFLLPNPAGRVMGSIGTVTDSYGRNATYGTGDKVGEINHQLTVPEMPSHNHNHLAGTPGATNTTLDGTTSSYTHDHGDTGDASSSTGSVRVIGDPTNSGHEVTPSSGTHSHSISNDTHSHTISSNGNDQFHNNMQPTLFYGNTFIYCGDPMRGKFPFTTGLAPVLI